MAKKIKYIILLSMLVSLGLGQLRSDLGRNDIMPKNISGTDNSIMSLFDPSRFSMNHSFSMSMMNMNNQSSGVASYTNNMNFTLRDNLKLQTYMTFMQPNMISSDTPNPYLNNQLFYSAVLNYNPTQNTHLQISFGNYPLYSRRQASPFSFYRGY